MKIFAYFSFLIVSFFFFNIMDANSIDADALIYDKNDLYSETYHTISFYDLNVYEIGDIFKDLDIKIINIKPTENMYFKESISYRNNEQIIEEYVNSIKSQSDEYFYYKQNGFNVKSMKILCTNKELIKLEKRIEII